jgi:hypothetical protein
LRRNFADVARVEVRRVRLDARGAAGAEQRLRGREGLGHSARGVVVVEEHLTREVRDLDDVAVDEHQGPDPRAREALREHAAGRSAADDEDARGREALLSGASERREAHLAVEAVRLVSRDVRLGGHGAPGSSS